MNKEMKVVEIVKDMPICGCPVLKAETKLSVIKSNSRFVYVNYIGCELRLSLKDIKVVKRG